MKFIKNYKSTLILLFSIVVGVILGSIFKDDILVLKPFGEIFLNMLLVVIVPLIGISIATSIYKMNSPKRMGKILISTLFLFFITSVVALLIGIVSTYSFDLVSVSSDIISGEINDSNEVIYENELNLLDRTVSMITVDDFSKLLSKDNMIALIVISLLVGVAMHMASDKAKPMFILMESVNEVINKFLKLIMYYAPIGICAYIACLVGTFGTDIAYSYLYLFLIYLFVII